MPEMTFAVTWPDGTEREYYSPSLVVHDFLVSGEEYTVLDLVGRTERALQVASDRVAEKFGFACTSAAATRQEVLADAGHHDPAATVRVGRMHPPLPAPDPRTQGATS
ncbi:MAG: hypothetical protein CMH83_01575 [Nocardioides sp.]|nr:hypothetical protein [Nocardioides sp.]